MVKLPTLPEPRWLPEAEAGALVLTATGRLQRHLHEVYAAHQAQQGRVVWTTPTLLTWRGWLERQWQERVLARAQEAAAPAMLLNEAQTAALWQHVIAADGRTRDLLHAPGLARQAEEAWGLLHAWDVRLAPADARSDTPEEARFAAWAQAYGARSGENGWTDTARLPSQVTRWIAEGGHPVPQRVLLAGFDLFDPGQERLIAALVQRGCVCFELEPPARGASMAAGTLQRVACADSEAEGETAARWARAQLEAGARSVGIVVQSLDARANQLSRVFRDLLAPDASLPGVQQGKLGHEEEGVLPFHISAASPFTQVPLVHAAFGLLWLDVTPNDLATLEAVLRSPYLGAADVEREQRGMLVIRLRGLGDPALSLETVARHAAATGCGRLRDRVQAAAKVQQRLPARQSHAGWAASFTELLRAVGWPGHGEGGRSLGSAEFQAYERWHDLLDELCSLDLVLPHVDRSEALARLHELAAHASFQPQADPAPVQILGHLEASGLAFDRLWVLGMDDESWPRPAQPNPFLPLGVQRVRGLPRASAERELLFAEQVTARLKAAADHVIFSHPLAQGAAKLRPSPLVADLPEALPDALRLSDQPRLVDTLRQHARLEERTEEPLRSLPVGTALRSGVRLFEDMAACPFRAQARQRLGAEESPLPEPGLSPADHGSLLHGVLQHVWTSLKTQAALQTAFQGEGSPALDAVVREGTGAVLDAFARRHGRLTPGLRRLEQERLTGLTRELLELDRSARPPFTVTASEQAAGASVGGVKVSLRVDRVDTLADGSRLLLDYKSGRVNPSQWLSDRPDAPQLPLYALTHAEAPDALAFVQVRTGEIKYAGVADEDIGIPGIVAAGDWRAGQAAQAGAGWPELLEGWLRVLAALGERFRAGIATVDPKARSTCDYCPLPGLCRIDERGFLARDGAAGPRGTAGEEESDDA